MLAGVAADGIEGWGQGLSRDISGSSGEVDMDVEVEGLLG